MTARIEIHPQLIDISSSGKQDFQVLRVYTLSQHAKLAIKRNHYDVEQLLHFGMPEAL